MMTGMGRIPTRSSTFSATLSGRGCRDGGRARSGSCSARRPAIRLSKRSAGPFEAGCSTSVVTKRWTIWLGCSTQTSVAGSTTTGATTSRLFIRPYGTSTGYWRDGLIGSSSPFDVTGGEHGNGSNALRDDNHGCSLTGGCCRDTAEQWEPDEARVSRPVLRAPGGEIPPGDSPCATNALTGTTVRNCVRDEGKSLEAGCQEQASNHRKLRR